MADSRTPHAAWLAAMPLAFVLLWSTGFIVAKTAAPHAPPLTFLLYRFAGVVIVLLPLVWLTHAANASVGFRPPEMTELYRLQRAQQVADLDSEQLDAFELGVKGSWLPVDLAISAFDMRKENVILRESNGYNVSDGRTRHRGLEYELRWRPLPGIEFAGTGTYARHTYDFSRAVEGGERIGRGNDVDTAPREIYRAAATWQPASRWALEGEWLVVGDYWLDAANAHRYPGHGLLNLRGRWRPASAWTLSLRLTNALDRNYADRADFAFGSYRYFPGRDRALFAEVAWARD